jgi:isopropylmalate/homocitrate/citramalate synthase
MVHIYLDSGHQSAAASEASAGASAGAHDALALGVAAALLSVAAGAWYARRRWQR